MFNKKLIEFFLPSQPVTSVKKKLFALIVQEDEELSQAEMDRFIELLNVVEFSVDDSSWLILACLQQAKIDFLFVLLKKGFPLLPEEFEFVKCCLILQFFNNRSLNTLFCFLYDITPSDRLHIHDVIGFRRLIEYSQLHVNTVVNDDPDLIQQWHTALCELISIEKNLVKDDPIAEQCLSFYSDILENSRAANNMQPDTEALENIDTVLTTSTEDSPSQGQMGM